MSVPELLSTGDVGRILGVSRQRVHQLRAAYDDFPVPVGQVGGRHVWKQMDIERWVRKHRPAENAG